MRQEKQSKNNCKTDVNLAYTVDHKGKYQPIEIKLKYNKDPYKARYILSFCLSKKLFKEFFKINNITDELFKIEMSCGLYEKQFNCLKNNISNDKKTVIIKYRNPYFLPMLQADDIETRKACKEMLIQDILNSKL